jgi:hypothetical protein
MSGDSRETSFETKLDLGVGFKFLSNYRNTIFTIILMPSNGSINLFLNIVII